MQTRRYDGTDVRTILIAMATNQAVCSRIASRWTTDGLFASDWSNLIGGWCVDHFRKFGTPPNNRLTARFQRWAEHSAQDKEVIEAVERCLQYLSDQHDNEERNGNADADDHYLIELASKHFNGVKVKAAHKQAQVELESGRYDDAYNRMIAVRKIQLGTSELFRPAEDFEAWDRAFQEDRRRPLVTYPDAVGEFIGDSFVRGEFYAFQGPDKTGKSSILRDLTYRACRNRRRVAFFDTGDGSYDEFLLQMGCRLTECAEFSMLTEWPEKFEDDGKLVSHEKRLKQVDAIDAFREMRRICRSGDALRVECHPNSTLSVAGIDSILAEWELDGWRPDVVVIDYADILAPPEGVTDALQQVDLSWKAMRRLSQSRNCLVVTATQSSAAAYGIGAGKLMGRKHFSGRKTKNAEVNGLIGINVSDDERKQQMARWSWVVRRKDRRRGAVTVAGCFDIGNPVILSRW